jgi:hypothetical protein
MEHRTWPQCADSNGFPAELPINSPRPRLPATAVLCGSRERSVATGRNGRLPPLARVNVSHCHSVDRFVHHALRPPLPWPYRTLRHRSSLHIAAASESIACHSSNAASGPWTICRGAVGLSSRSVSLFTFISGPYDLWQTSTRPPRSLESNLQFAWTETLIRGHLLWFPTLVICGLIAANRPGGKIRAIPVIAAIDS